MAPGKSFRNVRFFGNRRQPTGFPISIKTGSRASARCQEESRAKAAPKFKPVIVDQARYLFFDKNLLAVLTGSHGVVRLEC